MEKMDPSCRRWDWEFLLSDVDNTKEEKNLTLIPGVFRYLDSLFFTGYNISLVLQLLLIVIGR